MKISFIIPVHNNGKLLESIIQKIESIDLKEYEIILVDDGSKDDSALICERLSQKNKKTTWIYQANKGVSSARNTGLKNANGEYVLFLDADDTIDSEKMAELLRKLENVSQIDIAIFGLSFDYYYNNVLYRRNELKTPLEGTIERELWIQKLSDLYIANSLSPIWNKVFRRSFLIENNLYLRNDMFLYEDLEYSLRCMAQCSNILFEPDIIYHYRQSEDEGNAGRRLLKIDHIYNLVDHIETAFNLFEEKKTSNAIEEDIKNILISLYLVLAKEKIAVSNVNQIRQICDDFAAWYRRYNMEFSPESQVYARLLLDRKITRIILKRKYTKIRHGIAVRMKNTGIYQRLKG